MSTPEVGELLGHSPRTIQYWFERFQEEGLAGLIDAEGQGRPPSLSPAQRKQLGGDLRKFPTIFGYSQGQWDAVLVSDHLGREVGKESSVRQCQRLFYRLGFRRQKPRGVMAGAEPEVQEAYKNLRRFVKRDDLDLWNLGACYSQQRGPRYVMWGPIFEN